MEGGQAAKADWLEELAREGVVSARWVGLGDFLIWGRFGGSKSPPIRLSIGFVEWKKFRPHLFQNGVWREQILGGYS